MPLPGYVEPCSATSSRSDKDWFAYKLSASRSRARTVAAVADRADGHGVGSGGHRADQRRVRGHRRHAAHARPTRATRSSSSRRRGSSTRCSSSSPAASRCGSGSSHRPSTSMSTHRRGDHAAHAGRCWSTARTTRPAGSTRASRLAALAHALADASARIGHPIWILSDEPYNRIVFDGPHCHQPGRGVSAHGRHLLLRQAAAGAGHAHRLPGRAADLPGAGDPAARTCSSSRSPRATPGPTRCSSTRSRTWRGLSIDIGALQRRRDRLVPALRDMGYDASMPEGTFYTMARSPIEDDVAFGGRARAASRARAAGDDRRDPGLVPDQPDRVRRDGRGRDPTVRRGAAGGRRLAQSSEDGGPTGSRQRTVVPAPGAVSRLTSPPWARTRSRTIASPSPAPASSPDRQKRSNARAATDASIPEPVSATSSSTASGRRTAPSRSRCLPAACGEARSTAGCRSPGACVADRATAAATGSASTDRTTSPSARLRLEAGHDVGRQDAQVGGLPVQRQSARIGQGEGAKVVDQALELAGLGQDPLEVRPVRSDTARRACPPRCPG